MRQMCVQKGPEGSPTYDHLGYELDYYKCAGIRPRGRRRRKDVAELDLRDKAKIMRMDKDKVSAFVLMAWEDRIARDLGKPFHKVEDADFLEWQARGFAANEDDFDPKKIGKAEHDRITELATGSAFRK